MDVSTRDLTISAPIVSEQNALLDARGYQVQ